MSTPEKDPDVLTAETEKVKAEAESAKLKVRKEEREEREAGEPGATSLRDAERRQKIAEAEKAATAAKRDEISALIPDFNDVDRGKLEDKSEKPMFEAALAQQALTRAAIAIAYQAREKLDRNGSWRVLITADPELVSSDATYHDVATGLQQLKQAAEAVLREPETETHATAEFETTLLGVLPILPLVAPVASAVAAAVPPLLGVFSAQRTLKSADIQTDDLAGAAVAAGVLSNGGDAGTVVHDEFRLLPTDGVYKQHAELVELRQRLTALRLMLEDEVRTSESDDKAKSAVRLSLVESISVAIDTFNASLVAVPQGATRSPLGLAAAREQLHADGASGNSPFTHALLMKSEGGSVQQMIDDRPFLADDKVSIVATVSVTWFLITTATSEVIGAGAVGGTATAHGTVGERIQVTFDEA